jgi:uncharacterized protein with GYD domain
MTENPQDRSAQIAKLAESFGGKMEVAYWFAAAGEYDGMVIQTFPDEITGQAQGLFVRATGNLSSTLTLPLMTADEFKAAMEKLAIQKSSLLTRGMANSLERRRWILAAPRLLPPMGRCAPSVLCNKCRRFLAAHRACLRCYLAPQARGRVAACRTSYHCRGAAPRRLSGRGRDGGRWFAIAQIAPLRARGGSWYLRDNVALEPG